MKIECRSQQLFAWIVQQSSSKVLQFTAMGNDASTRRYFRFELADATLVSERHMIAVDAPPETEKNQRFVLVSKLLKQHGILVPDIHASDFDLGFLWIDDLGELQLSEQLKDSPLNKPYALALQTLKKIQAIDTQQLENFESFDRTFIDRELGIFQQWFIGKHCNSQASIVEQQIWQDFVVVCAQNATQQPQVAMHRDYHSRNLMLSENQIGVIDFQDMVIGPICYDLVSLLRDCYIAWPEKRVATWLHDYAKEDPRLVDVKAEILQRWFDISGLQRHLKALGIFARQHYQHQNSSYLKDIPRTWDYVLQVSGKYPELSDLHTLLTKYEANRVF
ncbi:hypothetical protein DBZ36_18020 [Alginatibacterium sediminis]|uniref:Aminoglycoside phosphotransferase domain-containing protein n=1 Tax=Alginatibacterium sediminis TaxID=2164068 RepID=A0A420E8M7_9ALTE|nr:phosphotransferase [Alginatibacterium sediminis]RKF14543.1 hypothetical protein DBZ36_18020 [Alginatibacterium sediminis]